MTLATLPGVRLAAAIFLTVIAGCGGGGGGDMVAPDARIGLDCGGCVVFRAARVFDGRELRRAVKLLVRDGTVVDLIDDSVAVAAREERDLGDVTVIPGLIDLHTHVLGSGGPYAYQPRFPPDHDNFKALLRAGVTTALDLGNRRSVTVEYRRRLNSGRLLGPRLLIAGSFVTPPGGHPCYDGVPPRDHCILVKDAEAVEPTLAPLLDLEPDVLKIVVESGTPGRPLPRMAADVEAAIAALAVQRGLPVLAHLTHGEEVAQSLQAGVTRFAHLVSRDRLPPALVGEMRAQGAVVVPTLVAWESAARVAHGDFAALRAAAPARDVAAEVVAAVERRELWPSYQFTPEYAQYLDVEIENQRANFRALLAAGVTIAAGTDCGVPADFCGVSMRRELELYVELGMTPLQALAAATVAAADLLGRGDLGRLRAGAAADFVVIGGDVSADIKRLGDVRAVYQAGVAIDRDALALDRTTSLVRVAEPVRKMGDPCTIDADCGDGALCLRYQRQCARTCSTFVACTVGTACAPTAAGLSACHPSDSCDAVAQSCANGAGCYVMGNGTSVCATPGSQQVNQECDSGLDCVRGTQCDTNAGICRAFCSPPPDPSTCGRAETCYDLGPVSSGPVGWCAF